MWQFFIFHPTIVKPHHLHNTTIQWVKEDSCFSVRVNVIVPGRYWSVHNVNWTQIPDIPGPGRLEPQHSSTWRWTQFAIAIFVSAKSGERDWQIFHCVLCWFRCYAFTFTSLSTLFSDLYRIGIVYSLCFSTWPSTLRWYFIGPTDNGATVNDTIAVAAERTPSKHELWLSESGTY